MLVHLPAGFPSPAEDYLADTLNITAYLIKRPETTFFFRVAGDSMIGAGINDGDLLVIDRAQPARDKSIIVARLASEFCVKRLRWINGRPWLYPENERYRPLEITEEEDFEVWGCVTHSITTLCDAQKPRVTPVR